MQLYIITLLALLLSSVKGQANGPIFTKSAAPGQCLSALGENIGVVLGRSAHTIQVRLTFPQDAPTSRQWLLNLGQRTSEAHHWIWNSPTYVQFGQWNGHQIQNVQISQCSDLTTTYSGSPNVYKLYCDGVFLAQIHSYLDIKSNSLDIGRSPDETDFAGCISEVKIWSSEKSAEEVANLHCWETAEVGVDLAWGEWNGSGYTSFQQCKSNAEAAGVRYFAWTGQVYGGYCKVLKPSIAIPNLNTNQGYGYKLWHSTCEDNSIAFRKECRWESNHDQTPNSADYMGWTCANDEILTGFGLSANQLDVTKVQCCKLGGHSSVKPNTCTYVDSNHHRAQCGNGNDHMVFSGAYDKRAAQIDAVTEILAGKCCEVECDSAWCAGKDWGVDKNNCQVRSVSHTNAQELVCPEGTLLTEIEDGLMGNAHGVQKVVSVTCCALDIIAAPTMAPSPAPTTAPTSAPTSMPSVAPTTVDQCLLSLRDSRLTDSQYLTGIDDCLPGCLSPVPHRRALESRLLSENNRRQ